MSNNNDKHLPASIVKTVNEAVDIINSGQVGVQNEPAQPTPLQQVFASHNNKTAKPLSNINEETMEKPKRPLTAYNLFFQEERRQLYSKGKQGLGFANLAKTIAAKWKMTPKEERKVFDELAVKDRARYDEEMKVWKKQEKKRKQATSKNNKPRQNGAATQHSSPRSQSVYVLPPTPTVPTLPQSLTPPSPLRSSSVDLSRRTPVSSGSVGSTPRPAVPTPPSAVLASPAPSAPEAMVLHPPLITPRESATAETIPFPVAASSPLPPPPVLPSSAAWTLMATKTGDVAFSGGLPCPVPNKTSNNGHKSAVGDSLFSLMAPTPLSSDHVKCEPSSMVPCPQMPSSPPQPHLFFASPQEENEILAAVASNETGEENGGPIAMCWGDEELENGDRTINNNTPNVLPLPFLLVEASTRTPVTTESLKDTIDAVLCHEEELDLEEPLGVPVEMTAFTSRPAPFKSLTDRFGEDCTDTFIDLFHPTTASGGPLSCLSFENKKGNNDSDRNKKVAGTGEEASVPTTMMML